MQTYIIYIHSYQYMQFYENVYMYIHVWIYNHTNCKRVSSIGSTMALLIMFGMAQGYPHLCIDPLLLVVTTRGYSDVLNAEAFWVHQWPGKYPSTHVCYIYPFVHEYVYIYTCIYAYLLSHSNWYDCRGFRLWHMCPWCIRKSWNSIQYNPFMDISSTYMLHMYHDSYLHLQ